MSAKRAERLQVMLTIDEVRRVEEWRYENRMPSRSAAVRALMNLGLRAHAAVDQAAMLERSVASQDVGVTESGALVEPSDSGSAVLVVAGDRLVGLGLGRLVEHAGFRVVGPARSPGEAQALSARDSIAAAVIDVTSTAETVGEIADRLADRPIPFAFVIGDREEPLPSRHRSVEVISHANAEERLGRVLAELIA